MSTLRPLLPYLRRHRGRLLFGIVMIVANTILGLTQPYLLGRAIAALNQGRPQSEIITLAGAILGLVAVQAGVLFAMRMAIIGQARIIEYEMRSDLFAHLQEMEHAFFQEMHTGDIMARATNDLNAVREMLGPGIMNSISTTLMFGIAMVLMFSLNPLLAAVVVIVLPLVSVAFVIVGRRMHRRYEKVQSQFGVLSTMAQENFSGIRVVKAYGQEEHEIQAFATGNHEYLQKSLAFFRLEGLMWPMMSLVLGTAAALILLVGGNEVIAGRLTLGQFVQFNGYLALLSWPMIALGWVVTLYQRGTASLGRLNAVMRQAPAIADSARTQPVSTIKGDIEFDNVSLTYEERPVLQNVSFHVPAGQTLAIVGATGAGKTSIVNLLTRVVEAAGGTVRLDGVDVREIPLAVLRRNIGYVPQDTFLFSVPLRENVAFGVDEPTPAAVARAVETARLSKDVDQFPQGLDTMIGERGVTLSGGQKQRTALARAIMRDPAILILDDALSSIDTQTQAEILSGLRQVLAHRTSIIISQRISTVKAADEIIVLDDGRIIEQGTHQQLLTRGGVYARMYRRELLSQELDEE
jgi:ATP-binding cassette subfamily B protein